MELTILAAEATRIAFYVIDKATGGALEKAGADVLDFLRKRFHGRLTISQADNNGGVLQAAIVSEAIRDQSFQDNLEKLVAQFNQIQNKAPQVNQNTQSGVNVNINDNSGTFIGQQIGQQFFR